MRRPRRIVEHPLLCCHVLRLEFVIAAGVEIAVVFGKRGRRNRDPQPVPFWDDDASEPEVDVIAIDTVGSEQHRPVESLTEARTGDPVLDAQRPPIRIDLEQHYVPIGVARVRGRPQRGRHRAGYLDRFGKRWRREDEHVRALRLDFGIILVEVEFEFAGIYQVWGRIAGVVRERVRRFLPWRYRVEQSITSRCSPQSTK